MVRMQPENMHDAYQATLLSSANSFSDSEDLALEVGEVQRPLEKEKSTLVIIFAWDRDTPISFHRGELGLDGPSSSSPPRELHDDRVVFLSGKENMLMSTECVSCVTV